MSNAMYKCTAREVFYAYVIVIYEQARSLSLKRNGKVTDPSRVGRSGRISSPNLKQQAQEQIADDGWVSSNPSACSRLRILHG